MLAEEKDGGGGDVDACQEDLLELKKGSNLESGGTWLNSAWCGQSCRALTQRGFQRTVHVPKATPKEVEKSDTFCSAHSLAFTSHYHTPIAAVSTTRDRQTKQDGDRYALVAAIRSSSE